MHTKHRAFENNKKYAAKAALKKKTGGNVIFKVTNNFGDGANYNNENHFGSRSTSQTSRYVE